MDKTENYLDLKKIWILIGALLAIQVVAIGVWVASNHGCTEHVPFSDMDYAGRYVLTLWAMSSAANLVVVLTVLSDYFRRPRLLLNGLAIGTMICFIAWRAVAFVDNQRHASQCGQPCDFLFPCETPVVTDATLEKISIATWLLMIGFAVASLRRQPQTKV